MNNSENADAVPPYAPGYDATKITISHLVARVYEAAPSGERCRILQHLMKPLGALALVAVANGLFAKICIRKGWNNLQLLPEDTEAVTVGDVVSLVDYVQQASFDTVLDLPQLLNSSPVVAGMAATVLLVSALTWRNRSRAGTNRRPGQ